MNAETTAFLTRVARDYDALPMDDANPDTLRCYAALCLELVKQFDILRAFVTVQFTDADPYPDSRSLFEDIESNRVLRVFTGGEPIAAGHVFGCRALGTSQTYNHIFRAVHDGLAHYPGRHGFGPLGELRAFQANARLLSPSATLALATETLGQNACYNFGERRGHYAPQKFALLPPLMVARALMLET